MAHPPSKKHTLFARCLSAVIARRMRQDGYSCIHDLFKMIPESANIPPMTVYSQLYARGRPSLWIMYHIAKVLGVTADFLCEQAMLLLDSGAKLPTVYDLFFDASPAGRGRVKKRVGRPPKRPAGDAQKR